MVKKDTEELLKQISERVQDYKDNPEEQIRLMNFMSRFKHYSLNNMMLIDSQYENAYGVASYKDFQKLGYQVKKGEKAIKILAPAFTSFYKDEHGIDRRVKYADNDVKERIKAGEIKTTRKLDYFFKVNVFDITQTNAPAEEYPKLYPNKPENFDFEGTEEDLELLEKTLIDYSESKGIAVHIGALGRASKGFFSPVTNRISVSDRLPLSDRIHVLTHELAHAEMHNIQKMSERSEIFNQTSIKEYQAEMTAYVVSTQLGLDTEESATRYLKSWTDTAKETKDLIKNMEDSQFKKALAEVKDVSNGLTEILTERFTEMKIEQELEQSTENELVSQIREIEERQSTIKEQETTVLKREDYKEYLRELIEDDETLAHGEEHEIIYEIDDIKIYGGYEDGVRGVDHQILLSEEHGVEYEDIIRWGTVVVPETESYISDNSIEKFDELGFNNLPTNDNHIVKSGRKIQDISQGFTEEIEPLDDLELKKNALQEKLYEVEPTHELAKKPTQFYIMESSNVMLQKIADSRSSEGLPPIGSLEEVQTLIDEYNKPEYYPKEEKGQTFEAYGETWIGVVGDDVEKNILTGKTLGTPEEIQKVAEEVGTDSETFIRRQFHVEELANGQKGVRMSPLYLNNNDTSIMNNLEKSPKFKPIYKKELFKQENLRKNIQEQKQQIIKEQSNQKELQGKEKVAHKTKFLTDSEGNNRYNDFKDKVLKVKAIKVMKESKYKDHSMILTDGQGNDLTAKIRTSNGKHNGKSMYEKWQKGMTGEEWLNQDSVAKVLEKRPEIAYKAEDISLNEMDRDFQKIEELSSPEVIPSR